PGTRGPSPRSVALSTARDRAAWRRHARPACRQRQPHRLSSVCRPSYPPEISESLLQNYLGQVAEPAKIWQGGGLRRILSPSPIEEGPAKAAPSSCFDRSVTFTHV